MKKSIVILISAVAFIIASCSTYTCPTYSKGAKENSAEVRKI